MEKHADIQTCLQEAAEGGEQRVESNEMYSAATSVETS